MKEAFVQYLDALRNGDRKEIIVARENFQRLFAEDYRREQKLWVKNHADEVDQARKKPVQDMTLHEVLVCLTNIVARERIFCAMSGCEESGLTEKLLTRYLEVTENAT